MYTTIIKMFPKLFHVVDALNQMLILPWQILMRK